MTGTLGGRLALSGTAGAPRLVAALALEDGAAKDVGPLAGEVALEAASGALRLTGAVRLAGAPLLVADVRVPLDGGGLLRRPVAKLRALPRTPLAGTVEVPGLALASIAGKGGLPEGLAGTVTGSAALGGTLSRPRGRATLTLAGGAWAGYHDVSARFEVTAEQNRTAVAARGSLGAAEALRLEGALGAALESMLDRKARREAPLRLDATIPSLPLAAGTDGALPLSGTVTARIAVRGTLARPEGRLEVEGKGIALDGHPVGDLSATIVHDAPTSTADFTLRPASGGALAAHGTVTAPHGFAEPAALRQAAATLRVQSDRLDLGFLALVAPRLVRRASGRLTIDLAASGPLAGLRPRGSVKLAGGHLDVVGLGDWSGIELVAAIGERDVEVSRLEARRGGGRFSGRLSIRDLGTAQARLAGRIAFEQLALTRDGEVLAVLDLPVELEGTVGESLLDATATIGAGTIRLPRRSSGALQQVQERADIVDADALADRARRRRRIVLRGTVDGAPYEVRCRVLVPGKLFVKSERPAANLEVKGDSTWRLAGGELSATGSLEVVRGTVEPISGRVFHVERARVSLPGGAVTGAQLDVVARYDNPVAVVTVTLTGPVTKPAIQMSSRPPLDDASIAMLIATGRTEMNLNTTGVAPMTAQEAGSAMVAAAASAAFTGLAEKLPVDQLSVDTSRVRAGKYLTDKLFLGYAYRFDAKPENGENLNEVTAEYRFGTRWKLEVRYGDAPAGDASVIWSFDY